MLSRVAVRLASCKVSPVTRHSVHAAVVSCCFYLAPFDPSLLIWLIIDSRSACLAMDSTFDDSEPEIRSPLKVIIFCLFVTLCQNCVFHFRFYFGKIFAFRLTKLSQVDSWIFIYYTVIVLQWINLDFFLKIWTNAKFIWIISIQLRF